MGRRKRIVSWLLGTAAALALIVGVLLWFAGTETALNWATRQAVAAAAGRLRLEGVHGSLYGPLRIERAVFETPERRVVLTDLILDWSPWDLLQRRLLVSRLDLKSLEIELKPSGKAPPQLPRSLRLPLPLRVSLPAAAVGRVRLALGGRDTLLRRLRLGLDYAGAGYRLRLAGVETPWGDAEGDLSLDAASPFALHGTTRLTRSEGDHPYRVGVRLGGTLARITVGAEAVAGQATARGQAVAAPFRQHPLERAELAVQGVDPAMFGKGLPRARLSATLSLAGKPDGTLQGRLQARNALPGSLDRQRLPLSRLRGAFQGSPQRLTLHDLELDLGPGGRLRGDGSFAGGRLDLKLATGNLDLRGLYGKLAATRLRGKLNLGLDAADQTVNADLAQDRYRFRVDAARERDRLIVRSADARSGPASLAFQGEMALTGPRAFRATGRLKDFDPARFGDYPQARVSASFAASGLLLPKWWAALEFTIGDSSWRGQPLRGGGRLRLSASRIRQGDVELGLGDNRLSAQGAFGGPGDRLHWRLEANRLAVLGPAFGGSAVASGTLEGAMADPSGSFSLSGRELRWGERLIADLRADGRLGQGPNGALDLRARLSDYRSPDFDLNRAAVALRGSRGRHRLEISAANRSLDLEAAAVGGWREKAGWSGKIERLVNRGRYELRLAAPAALSASRHGFALEGADLDFAGGRVSVHRLSLQDGRWTASGQAEGLQGERLLSLAAEPPSVRTSLVLGAKWSITAGKQLDGNLDLWRQSGDLTVPTEPPLALGLSRLSLHATAAAGLLSADLEAAGSRLGTLSAQGRTRVSRRDGAWGVAGNAPLWLEARADIASLAWIGPLLNRDLSVGGSLHARLDAAGTVAAPRFEGAIAGSGLEVALPEQGIDLRDGSLRAELAQDRLLLRSLAFHGGKGRLSAKGSAAWTQGAPQVQLEFSADKLEAVNRPDRRLVLSGNGRLALAGRQLDLSAKLKADQGLVELPKEGAPTLGRDVVVLGRTPPPKPSPPPFKLRLDADLDLGDHFLLRGRGVDAQLGGTLRVRAADGGLPTANGTIRVVKGSYMAYGQRLTIERGELNFVGPLDDPGLNIVAMRKNQAVEAGVAISGTAAAPRVTLVSNPTVPDGEKLAWLVLGHGLSGAGTADFSLMQAAAGALLSQGESLNIQSQITQATGLDEFGLRGSGDLAGTVLTLGKRLSSRVYLSYEQSLSGASNLVKIKFDLTKRLSLRTQTGSDSAVDLFYTFSFN